MYTERKPYLATPGTDSCWQTWHNSTVQGLHHRQTRSHGAEGWKDASEDNKWMIVLCSTFSKSLNPRNIDKSVSDIWIRIRFPFESSFWISLSGCKLTILPDIQPANRIVIISDIYLSVSHFAFGRPDYDFNDGLVQWFPTAAPRAACDSQLAFLRLSLTLENPTKNIKKSIYNNIK